MNKLVELLIESGEGSEETLAYKLGVSASTVSRWRSGSARPRPSIEGQLRKMASTQREALELREDYDLFSNELSESHLKSVITNTLHEVREILHRTGRLSSRHEALDEVGKLLFAHVMSIADSGTGISRKLLSSGFAPAIALQRFVKPLFDQHLPQSLAHELHAQDFALRLKESENRFALEIIDCFDRLASRAALAKMKGPRGVDILNDTFGQFLADSFVDEKELGQYLTPTEVVKFMVRLGLDSIEKSDLDKFCDFRRNAEAGYILDPSCGVGSFLSEVFRTLYERVSKSTGEETLERWTKTFSETSLVGIDKSERMVRLALTNLAMFGVPTANLHLANALVRSGNDASVSNSLEGKARLILTNPPFGATFPINEIAYYKIASRWCRNPLRSADSEVLFMERYIDWLAPGGVLVAIVPDSILTNRGVFEDLRQGLSAAVEIVSIISLPQVTFGVAGTNTKTSIIHLRKRDLQPHQRKQVYCAVCENIGYEVSSRGARRTKVATGTSDLGAILLEATHQAEARVGTFVEFHEDASRWDASYHAGPPLLRKVDLGSRKTEVLRVRDVADLVTDRGNPQRRGNEVFDYIEIADVDGLSCNIRSKPLRCDQAPSRARKPVKAGDVLVSTVRPERRTIGVVPRSLDGAICSTGFAVLRPKTIDALVLARLLQTDISNAQILRNNSGIAYPVIDETCLPDVVLPIMPEDLKRASAVSEPLIAAKTRVGELELALDSLLKDLLERWNRG